MSHLGALADDSICFMAEGEKPKGVAARDACFQRWDDKRRSNALALLASPFPASRIR